MDHVYGMKIDFCSRKVCYHVREFLYIERSLTGHMFQSIFRDDMLNTQNSDENKTKQQAKLYQTKAARLTAPPTL